jgi:hypothetical protein
VGPGRVVAQRREDLGGQAAVGVDPQADGRLGPGLAAAGGQAAEPLGGVRVAGQVPFGAGGGGDVLDPEGGPLVARVVDPVHGGHAHPGREQARQLGRAVGVEVAAPREGGDGPLAQPLGNLTHDRRPAHRLDLLDHQRERHGPVAGDRLARHARQQRRAQVGHRVAEPLGRPGLHLRVRVADSGGHGRPQSIEIEFNVHRW